MGLWNSRIEDRKYRVERVERVHGRDGRRVHGRDGRKEERDDGTEGRRDAPHASRPRGPADFVVHYLGTRVY